METNTETYSEKKIAEFHKNMEKLGKNQINEVDKLTDEACKDIEENNDMYCQNDITMFQNLYLAHEATSLPNKKLQLLYSNKLRTHSAY